MIPKFIVCSIFVFLEITPVFAAEVPAQAVFEQSDPFIKPAHGILRSVRDRDYEPIAVGGWLVAPTLNAGAMYDSNIFSSGINRLRDWALRLTPSVVAESQSGLFRTRVYALADATLYSHYRDADTVTARAGFTTLYSITPDLRWRGQAEYSRQIDPLGTGSAPSGTIYYKPVQYDTLFSSTSIEKSFDRIFISLGASFSNTKYHDTSDSLGRDVSQSFRDYVSPKLLGRVGYRFAPTLYAFVEPSLNWMQYTTDVFNSHGTRLVGGVGSDRIGLFRGELYGGYETQYFDDVVFGTQQSPIYGGRLSWFPRRDVTLSLNADRALSVSGFAAAPGVPGTVTATNSITGSIEYLMWRNLTLTGLFTYSRTDYVNTTRQDDLYRSAIAFNYLLTPTFGVTMEIAHLTVNSNVPDVGYAREQITIAGTTRF